ncbi:ATP-binding protein [Mucilaginibacter sp. OK283]|uniref:ATP-binding protein n=1 Tax=Mucilaginibacter sp. OK283 TaxID=1881049 RepID=UPI0008D2FECD|nr:ATP-binding protein [Mucilaginibacter sp. OK283]SEP36783.1 Histidine kinase-, DNA gyrase B-, and HSP90-like ATPase [Mucilaginibacter sp. OK283]
MPPFRTKARAVDLLGKGQIADLPTAITELWKNGFDAYADNLTAEIYLKGYKDLIEPIFVMTDDGKGMSNKDIFDKWLVLGTDSKSRTGGTDEQGADTLWKKPRIKAGEKGIGRLSVAFLGSPMLMLTKKIGYKLQAMYFDWRLLENFNLFLDDIQIPVFEISTIDELRIKFDSLKKEFLKNFEKTKDSDGNLIWEKAQTDLRDTIVTDTKKINLPNFFEEELLHDIIDLVDDHGTKFVIFQPEEQILNLINLNDNNDNAFVQTSLAGFTNQFKDKSERLPINTFFPIHREVGNDTDFLNQKGNFFTPDDYNLADIIIEGDFDGNGGFIGNLKIYNETIPYKFSNSRKKDSRSYYGAFPIKLGYSQGNFNESKLDRILYDKISSKVDRYGALYLYRDGFRILPYGRTEYDFLEFEKRRSMRAGTWFFSHRRMFGFIELERNKNEYLKDKSSREGLINNAPYRAFKNDLEAFFIDLAKEYFSSEAKKNVFLNKKNELKDQSEAIKKDKKRETEAKKAFSRSLKEYPNRFKEYQQRYKGLLQDLQLKLNNSKIVYQELEHLLEELQKLDLEFKNLIPQISKAYKPTDLQLDRLYKYEDELVNFNDTVKKESESLLAKVQKELQIKELKIEFVKQCSRYQAELEAALYSNKGYLDDKFRSISREFENKSLSILDDLKFSKENLERSITTKEDVINNSLNIKEKFDVLLERINSEITPLVEHVRRLSFDIDEELVQGAYRAEYENIKYQWEQTRDAAQLGIAVEIIDHEFNVLYSQINSVIDKLDSEMPQKANSLFNNLKRSFKSLEDKYGLLSPLYRISGVSAKTITCKSLFEYLEDFFERKIHEEAINFSASKAFLNHSLEIKEPVIHTVFINLVNNAIYWLRAVDEKLIFFDYIKATGEILIMNSGLKIEERRIEKIFDLFYSNRPGGRGIGLYLSKQSLADNYFDIYATNDPEYNRLNGACFVLKPITF